MNLINLSLWLNRGLAATALVTLFVTKDAALTGGMLAGAMVLYLVHQSLCAHNTTTEENSTLAKPISSSGSEYRNLQEQFNRHNEHHRNKNITAKKQVA